MTFIQRTEIIFILSVGKALGFFLNALEMILSHNIKVKDTTV